MVGVGPRAPVRGHERGKLSSRSSVGFARSDPLTSWASPAFSPPASCLEIANILGMLEAQDQAAVQVRASEKECLQRAFSLPGQPISELVPALTALPRRRRSGAWSRTNMRSPAPRLGSAREPGAAEHSRALQRARPLCAFEGQRGPFKEWYPSRNAPPYGSRGNCAQTGMARTGLALSRSLLSEPGASPNPASRGPARARPSGPARPALACGGKALGSLLCRALLGSLCVLGSAGLLSSSSVRSESVQRRLSREQGLVKLGF